MFTLHQILPNSDENKQTLNLIYMATDDDLEC